MAAREPAGSRLTTRESIAWLLVIGAAIAIPVLMSRCRSASSAFVRVVQFNPEAARSLLHNRRARPLINPRMREAGWHERYGWKRQELVVKPGDVPFVQYIFDAEPQQHESQNP